MEKSDRKKISLNISSEEKEERKTHHAGRKGHGSGVGDFELASVLVRNLDVRRMRVAVLEEKESRVSSEFDLEIRMGEKKEEDGKVLLTGSNSRPKF